MSMKIEQAKKTLANAWATKQITTKEYRQAIQQLEDKSKNITSTKNIEKENVIPTAPRVPEIDHSQYKDIDYFEDGVLIPRDLYESNLFKEVEIDGKKREKHRFTSKAMYSVFYLLCKYGKNGKVIGLTTDEMAQELGYSDSRNLRNALDKLESEGIIEVNRNVKPFVYELADYNKSKGYFVVPERLMGQVKDMKLKQLRLEWTYMLRNHLSPRNDNKSDLSLGHLRRMINADCYKEVLELADSLRGRFFDSIQEIKTGFWRSWNSLKVSFNNVSLGIVENVQNKLEEYKSHHLYKSINYIFDSLEINSTAFNYRQAIDIMNEYTERELLIVKQNVQVLDKSYSGSSGYLRHLLQRARTGAIVMQY